MLLSTFVVSNTGDSGPGTFRQAILDSNAATGQSNTIDFDIPESWCSHDRAGVYIAGDYFGRSGRWLLAAGVQRHAADRT